MLIYFTSFAAGLLSALSPCVLPVLPVMAGSAVAENKRAPLYIASGMVLSFVLISTVFNMVSSLLGLSESFVKNFSAAMILLFGIVLAVPKLKEILSSVLFPVSSAALRRLGSIKSKMASGHFGVGLMLGAAWGPCVGPTLGLALGLASSREGLMQALPLFRARISVPGLD